MKRLRYENGAIDSTDIAIIEQLVDDARLSVAEIARRIGLSSPSVRERLARLEEAGVIEGYTLKLNAAAIGLKLTVWLRIRPMPGELRRVADILRETPEIVECDRITGEDCYIAKAHVRDVLDLETLIDRFAEHAATNTSVVQSSPVSLRLPSTELFRTD